MQFGGREEAYLGDPAVVLFIRALGSLVDVFVVVVVLTSDSEVAGVKGCAVVPVEGGRAVAVGGGKGRAANGLGSLDREVNAAAEGVARDAPERGCC